LIEDGYVWGRGAIDVKAGVILWLEAVEALLAEGVTPSRTIYLSFGHDEEVGGQQGAQRVAQYLSDHGIQLAFLFDEGGSIYEDYPLLPDRIVANVVTAEKAYYTVELRARGVSGHSSIPPRHTAIGKLARAITRIEENPMPARLSLPVREMLSVVAPELPLGRRFAMQNLWLMGGFVKRGFLTSDVNAAMVRTTFAATLIEGGVKENVIPELAKATVNVRILPGDSPEDVIAHLTRVIDDPEIEISGEAWGEAAPPASMHGPAFQLAASAVQAEIPEAVVLPGLVPGATDTRHFVGVADEILRFVPQQLGLELVSGAHGRDERIAVEPLGRSRRIAIGMMRRAAAGE
jgi:carboxypeptidase PM20D1